MASKNVELGMGNWKRDLWNLQAAIPARFDVRSSTEDSWNLEMGAEAIEKSGEQ